MLVSEAPAFQNYVNGIISIKFQKYLKHETIVQVNFCNDSK